MPKILGGPGSGVKHGMFSTGDLLPQASGSASIGVNQVDGVGGFAPNSIKPYAHIHMNSGVWHDITGSSGILRFANGAGQIAAGSHILGQLPALEISSNGGKDFSLRLGSVSDPAAPTFGPHGFIQGGTSTANRLFILNSGQINLASELSDVNLSSAGNTNIVSADDILAIATNDVQFSASRNITHSANLSVTVAADQNVSISAGNIDTGGQLTLKAFASSGRLEFRFGPYQAWYEKLTHSSTGGPFNDGFWPIPHSGQIAEMIAKATPGGTVDLQVAYNNGNEIDVNTDLIGYKGVSVRETIPGRGTGFTSNTDVTNNKQGKYGIAVSGFTLTPTNINSYAIAALNSSQLMISSSGTPSTLSRNFFLGYAVGLPQLLFFSTNGNMQLAAGDDASVGIGGQIDIRPFQGSGRMEYRFGPHQGWYEKLTHAGTGGPSNDGYWPISNSGQMLEQIVRREKSKSITIERPAVNNDLTWFYANQAITVLEVESVCRGLFDASGQFAIRYASSRAAAGTELTATAITCTNRTTGQITTSFAAANIPVDNWVWIAVSGVSGVATSQLHVTMHFN